MWTGFVIGFLGSFHCIGMCGPIALALPIFNESYVKLLLGRVLYNLGRIVTYTLFGALFGLFGKSLELAGLQQNVSITIGIIMLVVILMPRKYKNRLTDFYLYRFISNFIKTSFSKLTQKKSNYSLFIIGVINGFLPCGFVYVALAGAVSTGSIYSGSAFMALFGFGTFPIMLVASLAGKYISLGLRSKINKLIPVLALILAVIFILRGLNLGIPYLSPKLNHMPINEEVICH
ncbi:MAG: sulfite exporter TauE/SafE family protein [Bacteroidetes bacterium]|nr:sulfite exporter TauE/SafE family protein [Bacteroidota bacterium]